MARALRLNLYRLIPVSGVQSFDEFCNSIINRSTGEPDEYSAHAALDFEARLYVRTSDARRPDWAPFLEGTFGPLTSVNEGSAHGALLIVRSDAQPPAEFALSFGHGRHLLVPGTYEQNYGLRFLLNLLSQPTEGEDPEETLRGGALRSVDAKTLSNNILHTRRQTDRRTTFETFGVDTESDLVRAVTGNPEEIEIWGGSVTGGDSLRLNQKLKIPELLELCDRVEEMARRDDYKANYSWIDNVRAVLDPSIKDALIEHVVELLSQGQTGAIGLAPPAVIDWDQPVGFAFSTAMDQEFDEITIEGYLATLNGEEITRETLKEQRLVRLNGDGDPVDQWTILRSLNGEIHLNNGVYVLHDGTFYEIQQGYLTGLNNYLASLTESTVVMPAWANCSEEKSYNQNAADTSGGSLLLMDRKNIKINTQTSAIEFCDLLSKDRQFVHVKPYSGSATLSHLFAQGFVSADLLLMSKDFRERATTKITEQASNAGLDPTAFVSFNGAAITPSEYEVVYAIVGEWNGAPLQDVLPFFSKVTLRRTCENLRRMGYKVGYKLVERQ